MDGALADAKRCVELDPKWAKGYVRLGAAYYSAGELRKSYKAYEDGLKLDSNNAQLTDGMKLTQKALAAKASEIAENVRIAQAEAAARDEAQTDSTGSPSASSPMSGAPETVIGIDLGTTFSCVSVWKDGRVQVWEICASVVGTRFAGSLWMPRISPIFPAETWTPLLQREPRGRFLASRKKVGMGL